MSHLRQGEYPKLAQQTLLTSEAFRYDTLCFWLYADPAELRRRLDIRADDMLRVSQRATHEGYLTQLAQNNLLEDVRKLRSLMMPANSSASSTINLTVGLYQSIGLVHHLLPRKNCN